MLALSLPISLGIMAGLLGFALGVLLQQDSSYRTIQAFMVEDPYVYQSREHIYDALGVLARPQKEKTISQFSPERTILDDINDARGSGGDHSLKNMNKRNSVVGNYMRWLQEHFHFMNMFFAHSLYSNTLNSTDTTQVATIMKYGFPGLDDIHIYGNYVLSYNRRARIAHWVCEYIQGEELSEYHQGTLINPKDFIEDTSIPIMFRANPRDFEHTDWTACQMAAPKNHTCDQVYYTETFVMPNVVPINRSLKKKVWYRLEAHVRELAMQHGALHVYTGPLFLPQRNSFRNWALRHQVIGVNTVAVPTHLFKVIIVENKTGNAVPLIKGYVVPNVDIDRELELSSFLSDLRDIEHFAGLRFVKGTYQLLSYSDSSVARFDMPT